MPRPRPYKVALNGYGRIGRCVLRALFERGADAGFEIVALNDLADMASLEYLTRFDSTHGRFPGEIRIEGNSADISQSGSHNRAQISQNGNNNDATIDQAVLLHVGGIGLSVLLDQCLLANRRGQLAKVGRGA